MSSSDPNAGLKSLVQAIQREERSVEASPSHDALQIARELAKLPPFISAAYQQALQKATELVMAEESNPRVFLKFHHEDSREAALRLARYWTRRLLIFGDRAFNHLGWSAASSLSAAPAASSVLGSGSSMTRELNGALTEEHFHQLLTGTMVFLPHDSEGNVVLCLDHSRQAVPPDPRISLPTMFYMLSHCSSLLHHHKRDNTISNRLDSRTSQQGLVIICFVSSQMMAETSRDIHYLFEFIRDAFPIHLHRVHVAGCSTTKASKMAFLDGPVRNVVASLGANAKPLSLHVSDSPHDLLQGLQAAGLRREGLPETMGGTWKYQDFFRWLRGQKDKSRPAPVATAANKNQQEARSQQSLQETRQGLFQRGNMAPVHALHQANLQVKAPPAGSVGYSRLPEDSQSRRGGAQSAPQAFVRPFRLHSSSDRQTNTAPLQKTANDSALLARKLVAVPNTSQPAAMLRSRSAMMRQVACAAVTNAISVLPTESKAAYLEAMRTNPLLVQKESDPVSFYRLTSFNAVEAAKRLATYWQERKEFFGDRAFLPMSLGGEGALTSDDILLLNSGSVAILPSDSEGRTVVFVDRSRRVGDADSNRISRLRGVFYLACILSKNERNQSEGIVVVCPLITPRARELDYTFTSKLFKLSTSTWPIKIHSVHLTECQPKVEKKQTEANQIVANILRMILPGLGRRVTCHSGQSPAEILEELKKCGLRPDSLPSVVGGTWKFEGFAQWLRDQRSATLTKGRARGSLNQSAANEKGKNSVESRERKRRINTIHSRQKRERRRAEIDSMVAERDRLQVDNRRLRSEKDRLETLLGEIASKIVRGNFSGGSTGSHAPASETSAIQEDKGAASLSVTDAAELVRRPVAPTVDHRTVREDVKPSSRLNLLHTAADVTARQPPGTPVDFRLNAAGTAPSLLWNTNVHLSSILHGQAQPGVAVADAPRPPSILRCSGADTGEGVSLSAAPFNEDGSSRLISQLLQGTPIDNPLYSLNTMDISAPRPYEAAGSSLWSLRNQVFLGALPVSRSAAAPVGALSMQAAPSSALSTEAARAQNLFELQQALEGQQRAVGNMPRDAVPGDGPSTASTAASSTRCHGISGDGGFRETLSKRQQEEE